MFLIQQGWSDAHGNEKTLLGEYVYNHKGYALQSFPVQVRTKENGFCGSILKLSLVRQYNTPATYFAPTLTNV